MTYLSKKEITRKISGITKSLATQRKNIQDVLVSAACHAFVDGDVTQMEKLFTSAKGIDLAAIANWSAQYGLASVKDGKFSLNKPVARVARGKTSGVDLEEKNDKGKFVTPWHKVDNETKLAAAERYFAFLNESAANWWELGRPATKISTLTVADSVTNLVKTITRQLDMDNDLGEKRRPVKFDGADAAIIELQRIVALHSGRVNAPAPILDIAAE